MTGAEWAMLAVGLVMLLVAGTWHLGGILSIQRLRPSPRKHPHTSVLFAFWGLVVLHFSEIALGALVYAIALAVPEAGGIDKGYGSDAAGLLYFSGITFATLGYTQQAAKGPIQLLAMLQSLGGFMLITWSATFVYSIWEEQFRITPSGRKKRPQQDGDSDEEEE